MWDRCLWQCLRRFHPITVIFGMHSLFTPILVNELTTGGTDLLYFAVLLPQTLQWAGAALAVGIKAKKVSNKISRHFRIYYSFACGNRTGAVRGADPLKRPLAACMCRCRCIRGSGRTSGCTCVLHGIFQFIYTEFYHWRRFDDQFLYGLRLRRHWHLSWDLYLHGLIGF